MGERWRYWIDRGGTFTDVIACDPLGRLHVRKVLSERADSAELDGAEDAVIEAIRDVHGLPAGTPIPDHLIGPLEVGTTVATNALLERQGKATVLVTNTGYADALSIGYQSRPEIFARNIQRPEPLYADVVEIDVRIAADGAIVNPLCRASVARTLADVFKSGIRALAIHLMHGFRYPEHEMAIAAMAREMGFTQVTCGHEVSRLMGFIARGETCVLEAYLSPPLRSYVEGLAQDLGPKAELSFMQSHGGLIDAAQFRAKDAILSGPAGGVVGMVRVAEEAGFQKVIGFDMGGTSTDVSHYAGRLERVHSATVAGVHLTVPVLDIHTVAAGGGSLCVFDGARFRVGPRSAGATPGPACYRRGGPLTVTDCNVITGILQPDLFPHIFGEAGNEPLDADIVIAKFDALSRDIAAATGKTLSGQEIAAGFRSIANTNMANAIKKISTERGHDLKDYALICFGGAAGQHATGVADALGITTVVCDPLASVLSAFGIGCAELSIIGETSIEKPLEDLALADLDAAFTALAASLKRPKTGPGVREAAPVRQLHLKYAGTESTIVVPFGPLDSVRTSFEALYRSRFAFMLDKPIVVASISCEIVMREDRPVARAPLDTVARDGDVARITSVFMVGAMHDTPFYRRECLRGDRRVMGPAVIFDNTSTIFVEPDWQAIVDATGKLILTRHKKLKYRPEPSHDSKADPVQLEIFNNRFMAVAEEMGAVLKNTATSVNIKERLDFSCAVFDGDGALIANAPHIPVHLGSMGASIVAIKRARGGTERGLRAGDAYVLNNPYAGGTHLPDLTVVMPVFLNDDVNASFFVAARGHHADIGGLTPGSMPPESRTIDDEGVVIDDFLLVENGVFREAAFRTTLAQGRYPARNPDQNVADVSAQIAACARGADQLRTMVAEFGQDTVVRYMGFVRDNAAEAVRRLIDKLSDGAFSYALDNGAVVSVATSVNRAERRLRVDFTGTSPQRADNFNAPRSISRAAVLYVLRAAIDEDIPLNDGCLLPVDLIIPPQSMLAPVWPTAVVAGNVETSQVITDALFGAMGILAGSQGTMNNLTFGDGTYQYYETICGGAGAGPDFDGASAVQTHMTNSRLTDPEVLESRFPIRLERFAIRRGSGGDGRYRGGDGVIRHIRFLAAMQAAILSNRRTEPPFGLMGGRSGQVGRNILVRADGDRVTLPARAQIDMAAGDSLIVETPGGGGFGPPR